MNRRKWFFSGVAIASLAVALSIAGCSGEDQSKTIKVAYVGDPVTMDSMARLSGNAILYGQTLYDVLARYENVGSNPYNRTLSPRLAAQWKWIDDKTFRIWLREGVSFGETGNPVTGKDVVYSIKREIKAPDYKGLFSKIKDVVSYPNTPDMKNVVDIKFKTHDTSFVPLLRYLYVYDKKYYKGRDQLSGYDTKSFSYDHVSGAGPFFLESYQQGVKIVLKRNHKHWDAANERGNVERVVMTPIKDSATRVAALLSGDVDLIFPVPPESMGQVVNSKNTHLVTRPGMRTIMLLFNPRGVPAFKNELVRKAVNMVIDRKALVDQLLNGAGVPAYQLPIPSMRGYNAGLQISYDVQKAKELMQQAGYGEGFTINMIAPNNRYVNDEKVAQAVATMLGKINIRVNLRTMPISEYWSYYQKAQDHHVGLALIGWESDTGEALNFYEYLMANYDKDSGLGQYSLGLQDERLDRMIKTAGLLRHERARVRAVRAIGMRVYRKYEVVPLYRSKLVWGVRNGIKTDGVFNIANFLRFERIVLPARK